ncbi:MAG TPA: hypothetical protein DEA96_12040 [Leptospiraceae bacterium]|nr:hypothetical protein [Spirochaetaceae bacterium]HBS05690.1 hypothetical protein [Leptospiraceae bacterium]
MRKARAFFRFIRLRFNRSLGAMIVLLALAGWFMGWIRGMPAFVIAFIGVAVFLYRKTEDRPAESLRSQSDPEPVVVAQNPNYALIQIWAEALHDEGIPTEIRDEFMGSILTQPGRSYSEIKLLVPPRFETTAKGILDKRNLDKHSS